MLRLGCDGVLATACAGVLLHLCARNCILSHYACLKHRLGAARSPFTPAQLLLLLTQLRMRSAAAFLLLFAVWILFMLQRSPAFVHFFLDWIVKVANAAPGEAVRQRQQLLEEAQSG